MNLKVVCPRCLYHNDNKSEFCVNCGQKLKVKTKRNNNPTKISRVQLIIRFISAVALIMVIITIALSKNYPEIIKSPSRIAYIFNDDVEGIGNKTIYINQNDVIEIPKNIYLKMKSGKYRLVNIEWENIKIDTSIVGSTTIKGNIKEYNKSICYTVNILAHTIRDKFEDCIVENSMIEFRMPAPKDSKKIWFKIEKDGEEKNQVYTIEDKMINYKLYLPFGKGFYKVSVLQSDEHSSENYRYISKGFSVNNDDKRDLRFLVPDKYIESDAKEIIALANNITEKCNSDMEKTKAIHDWVASNITYDTDMYYSGKCKTYGAIETMNDKKALCTGYANLTAALNRAIGIKCKLVSGEAKDYGHAWNETFVDNKWIIQDVTWDAGAIDSKTHKFRSELSHKYFNPTSKDFYSNHTKSNEE